MTTGLRPLPAPVIHNPQPDVNRMESLTPHPHHKTIPLGLRIIAILKLVTSVLLTCAAFGAFKLLHMDVDNALEHFVLRLHLDPESRWINSAIASVAGIEPSHLKAIGAGTLCYALLYLIEGVGLWLGKHWAEYLVIIITGSLLPLEIYEVDMKASAIRITILAINSVILLYLVRQLKRDRRLHLKSSVVED